MLPFLSLSASTVQTQYWDGTLTDLEGVYNHHTMQVVYQNNGTPTALTVELHGSVDLSSQGAEGNESRWVVLATHSGEGVVTVNTHYVRYVKAVITEFTAPDQNCTISVSIASK